MVLSSTFVWMSPEVLVRENYWRNESMEQYDHEGGRSYRAYLDLQNHNETA
jgi:hypothetical protein